MLTGYSPPAPVRLRPVPCFGQHNLPSRQKAHLGRRMGSGSRSDLPWPSACLIGCFTWSQGIITAAPPTPACLLAATWAASTHKSLPPILRALLLLKEATSVQQSVTLATAAFYTTPCYYLQYFMLHYTYGTALGSRVAPPPLVSPKDAGGGLAGGLAFISLEIPPLFLSLTVSRLCNLSSG